MNGYSARYRRRYQRDAEGYKRARQHIREAAEFDQEMGGTSEDVKRYFFALQGETLKQLLDKYEEVYGFERRQYAEDTLPRWKTGQVKMSGMVAKRLFRLLPPMMPIHDKHNLVESLWHHLGPRSQKTYYVGMEVSVETVAKIVQAHLEQVVIPYTIPKEMQKRFTWLASGDNEMKQRLLNFFREQHRELLVKALEHDLPILTTKLRQEDGTLHMTGAKILQVGKHEVRVIPHPRATGISDSLPEPEPSSSIMKEHWNWLWWIIAVPVIILIFLAATD